MEGFVLEGEFAVLAPVDLEVQLVDIHHVDGEVLSLEDGLAHLTLKGTHVRHLVRALVLEVVDVTKGLLVAPGVQRMLALEVVSKKKLNIYFKKIYIIISFFSFKQIQKNK